MCLIGSNSSETQISELSCLVKNVLITDLKKNPDLSIQKSQNSWESEVENWEQLLEDFDEKHYESPSLEVSFPKKDLLEEKNESKMSLHSLNTEDQQAVMINTLEISNMPCNACDKDIYKAFDCNEREVVIKWINRTKAQLCFPSEEATIKAYFKYLSSPFSIGSLSPLPPDYHSIHSSISSAFTSRTRTPLTVFHKNTFLATLEPSKYPSSDKRPAKTSTVAKRLITGVLGVRVPRTPKEKAYDEMMIRQFLDTLKEKEAFERRKGDIWEQDF